MKNIIKKYNSSIWGKVSKKVELFSARKWMSVIECDSNFEEIVIITDSWNEEVVDVSMKVGEVILDSSDDDDDEDDQIDPNGEEDDAEETGDNFQLWFGC